MIIRESLIAQKKEILIKMLYNKDIILAWDFIKIKKVEGKVAPL